MLLAWRTPMLSDTAWLLSVAGRALDGERIYRDVWEVNPPLSYLIHVPAVVLARATGLSLSFAFTVWLTAWCTGAVALMAALWDRWAGAPASRSTAVAVAAVMLLVVPGPFFGQREHFILATAMPWAVLLAMRQAGDPVPTSLAAAAALSIAVAIAMKPFFIGWWFALPFLARPRRHWPEIWIVPLFGIVYIAYVLGATAYLPFIRALGARYWVFRHRSWLYVGAGNVFAVIALIALVVGFPTLKRPTIGRVLWTCTAAAWLAVVLQGKGSDYHYLPAIALGVCLLLTRGRVGRLTLAPIVALWIVGLGWLIVDGGRDDRRSAMALSRAIGPGSVEVLGIAADAAWLLTSDEGRPWRSPHMSLWWLERSGGVEMPSDTFLRASLLPAEPPDVLLLGDNGVDVAEYLGRSIEWQRVLHAYRPSQTIAGYRVWRREVVQ